jgi:Transcriptional regulator
MGKREDILDATLNLITEEGLQSMTFSKILSKANVGSATFYHYFDNKEDLVNELYKNCSKQMSEFVIKDYNSTATLYEKFRFFLKRTADFAIEHPDELWLLENYAHSPYISEEIRNTVDPTMSEFINVISEGQRQGIIKDMNPLVCFQIVGGSILFVIKGYLSNKYSLSDSEIQQTIEICWKGIKV